jgi:uncharacterized damage-inducible protein DinB
MRSADLQLIWEYNGWANEKIFAAAAGLSPEQLRQEVHSGYGTLFGSLLHIYDTEYGWRTLIQHGNDSPVITEQDVPTLDELTARSREEAAAWASYLGGLSDDDAAGVVRYDANGTPRERVLWHLLYHVVNHGSYHRGECAAALTALGRSPGELDFTIFLRERQS